jgi:hypothetical protein
LTEESKCEEERLQFLGQVYDPVERMRLEKILEIERSHARLKLLRDNAALEELVASRFQELRIK